MSARVHAAVASWIIVLCALSHPTVAQQTAGELQQTHPNNAKGFAVDKVFQVGEVDSVNLFNGNVVVRIPLGQSYTVGDHLSYQFGLTSNAKNWDYRLWWHPGGQPFTEAVPSWRANAGFGWLFSLGRLIAPGEDQIAHNVNYIYESPDGSDHTFNPPVQESWTDESGASHSQQDVWRTADGSNLRMSVATNGTRRVEFPDGTTQVFSSIYERWRLAKIQDRFGNQTTINYAEGSNWETWTISDRYRTHVATFLKDPTQTFDNFKKRLTHLEIAAFEGGVATYDFEYTILPIRRGCQSTGTNSTSDLMDLPTLTRIVCPDGSSWSFDYYQNYDDGYTCREGLISDMTYPTGGRVQYDYQRYTFNRNDCDSSVDTSPGVQERRLLDSGGNERSATTYSQQVGELRSAVKCARTTSAGEPYYFPLRVREWMVNTATTFENRSGIRSPIQENENYFSIWPDRPGTFDDYEVFTTPYDVSDYGLALMRTAPPGHEASIPLSIVVDGEQRLISTKTYAYESGNRELARVGYGSFSEFGEYPGGSYPTFPYVTKRLTGSRTVYYDDPLTSYVDTAYADYDGHGHFRKTTTTSSLSATPGSKRIEYTGYNRGPFDTGSYPSLIGVGMNRPWILNTFDHKSVEDSVWDNGAFRRLATHQTFELNAANGLLSTQRTFARTSSSVDSVPATGTGDLITTITYDTEGRVSDVRKTGGDGIAANQVYETRSTYTPQGGGYRGLVQSLGPNFVLNLSDADIDGSTGLVAVSRDSAGVATSYDYDRMGRLVAIVPTGAAITRYTYSYVLGLPRVDVTVLGSDDLTVLGSETYLFDGFGRVTEQNWKMPDGSRPSVRYTYNGLGWKISENNVGAITRYENFDAFGRARTIVAPDARLTNFTFTGTWRIESSVEMDTGMLARKREDYDHLGRLVSVTELADTSPVATFDANGVETRYAYGLGETLSFVCQNWDGVTCNQQRSFQYDARGFLKQETHPESGVTYYQNYDAAGHAWSKSKPAVAPKPPEVVARPSLFDQQFTYDAAGRLTLVRARNPYYQSDFRDLKSFAWGTENNGEDLQNGKLDSAVRHNYIPFMGDISVTEDYRYADAAGRRTDRVTEIRNDTYGQLLQLLRQTVTYDDLGNVTEEVYPQCWYEDCGTSPRKFEVVSRGYSLGRLMSISSSTGPMTLPIVNSISYHGTGMPTGVEHGNGIVETIAIDSSGMARPRQITFSPYALCPAPVISAQPQGQRVLAGQSVTLSVSATVTQGVIRYQWYNSFGAIGGATGPTYTTPALVRAETYYARVTSWCGETDELGGEIGLGGVFSMPAALEVLACSAPPAINAQPASATIPKGQAVTLSVGASGDGTVAYEWFEGDPPVTATPVGNGAASLTTGPLTTSTRYWVRVTNECGSTNSAAAVITVLACSAPPAVVSQPRSATIVSGQTATLSVTASSDVTPTYQWYAGTAGVTTTPVGTGSSYTTPALTSTKSYWVRVTNTCGFADSQTATITVPSYATVVRRQNLAAATSSGNKLSITWPKPTQAGSLLLAFVATNANVTVTLPAGWQLVSDRPGVPRLRVYAIENAQTHTSTENLNFGAATMATLTMVEYTGIETSGALDASGSASGTSATASSGTTSTTTRSNELVVTFLGASNATFGTASNGFAMVRKLLSISAVHDKIVTTTGAYGHTCTLSSSQAWLGTVLSFRAKLLP